MEECWDDEPKKRPKFSDIASFFKEMLDEDSTAVAILSTTNNQPQYCRVSQKCTPRIIFLVYFIYLYVNYMYITPYIFIYICIYAKYIVILDLYIE